MKPFSLAFNIAVQAMTRRIFPTGFDVGPGAPGNYGELIAYVEKHHRFMVSSENSDNTIFACAETNACFRAWHDWTHYILRAPFTLDGELAVAHRQIEDITRVFGHDSDAQTFAVLIMCEVYGQALYRMKHGEFPGDQRDFTINWLTKRWSRGIDLAIIARHAE